MIAEFSIEGLNSYLFLLSLYASIQKFRINYYMRVLNSLIDPRVGGPQLRALTVAEGLRKRDIETVFLVPNGSKAFEDLATDAGFEVSRPDLPRLQPPRNIRSNSRYVFDLYAAVRRIQRVIGQQDINVVHASMTLNFRAAFAAQRSSVPLVWFFNDTGTPWPLNRATGFTARILADEISVAADAVHSHFFTTEIPTRTIYPPVNTAKFDPHIVNTDNSVLRNDWGIDPDVPIIGTVGNINPVKGHEYLLRAIACVRNEYSQIAVPIVGRILDSRTDYYEELQSLRSQLYLEDTVEFVGHCSDIPHVLSTFDLFVLPSVAEACPIAVLEAMAMERPIVATRVGGVPEQIIDGEHGWLVPPRDPSALATAITDALDSPEERTCRGRAARQRAKAMFSLEQCIDRHVTMYEAALQGRN